METSDTRPFTAMLETALAGYGQPLPTDAMFSAWLKFLKPYPLAVVRQALAEHCLASEFPPRPVDIARRCREADGRPTADEAWAVAITAIDESKTVVWTKETEESFWRCKPLLDIGDKVGARRSFIDAYEKAVIEARKNGVPMTHGISLGNDQKNRTDAVFTAVSAGLIEHNPAVMLPADEDVDKEAVKKVQAHIDELKKILSMPKPRRDIKSDAERTAMLKAISDRKVKEWRKQNAG